VNRDIATAQAQAQALIAASRWDDASRLLVQALASDPESPDLRCMLSQCLLGLDRPADALTEANQAATADPASEWAHRLRAIALERLGRKREALAAAQAAVRVGPEVANAHQVLCGQQLALGDLGGAEHTARFMLQLAPGYSESHNSLGRVLLKRKRWREAEAEFREALRLQPDQAVLLNNLGVALQGQGRRTEAEKVYVQAVRLDPSLKIARKNLFSVTQAYVLGGGGLVVAVFVQVAAHMHQVARFGYGAVVLAIALGGILAVLALVALAVWRVRGLSDVVRSFYLSEVQRKSRRLRRLQIGVLGGGLLGLLAAYAGLLVDHPPTYQLVVAAVPNVMWVVGAPVAWARVIRPWLADRGWC
jgi:tetratricopeptide (TPR) repeat protein